MDSPRYKYNPLSTSDQEIRLLHLQPGNWHDEIHCSIAHISLNRAPEYEALSYVWGDQNCTVSIWLAGYASNITENLAVALRRLRKRREERIIWIDQLCINQTDVPEKTQQVMLMSDIYTSCKKVYLWLGDMKKYDEITVEDHLGNHPSNSVAAPGMDIVRQLSEGHLHEMSCFEVTDGDKLKITPGSIEGIEDLSFITAVKYWHRAWVVQENMLPKKAIAILGPYTLQWETFVRAAENYSAHETSCCGRMSETLDLSVRSMLVHFCTDLLRLKSIELARANEFPLYSLLKLTRNRRATDDRDKVFCLLGLVTDWRGRAPIIPDYTLTTVQLYIQVVEHVVNSMDGSLSVLTGNHWHRGLFPSWIPDWAAEDTSLYPYEMGWEVLYNCYDASLGQTAKPIIHGATTILLDGYSVDRIISTGSAMEIHDWKGVGPILAEWTELASFVDDKQPYITGGTKQHAFWRTIMGNLIREVNNTAQSTGAEKLHIYRILVPEDYATFELFKQELQTAVDGQWLMSAITMAIEMTVPITARHRKFFVTEKGLFGMGPAKTTVGDEVYVLSGSRLPFLARSKTTCEFGDMSEMLDSSIKRYAMIGECYLHGIMNGEVISNGDVQKKAVAFC